jgi:hypothetical protein
VLTVVTVRLRTAVTLGATGAGSCGDTVDVAADARLVTVWISAGAPGAGGLGPAGSAATAALETVCGADATAVDTVCDAGAAVLETACDTV